MAPTWNEQLQTALIQQYGNKKGLALYQKYLHAMPQGYTSEYSASEVAKDIGQIEKISADHPLAIDLQLSTDQAEYPLHLRLYQWECPIPLSDILPMLENFDLRTFDENPHKLSFSNNQQVWISDFAVAYKQHPLDIDQVKALFQEAFIKTYDGLAENDGFNKLVLGASFSWRQVMVLRAYAKYLHQVGFRFSQTAIENALVNNASIAADLINLFDTLHNPETAAKAKNKVAKIEASIIHALEAVTSLDEDRIVRRLLELMKATLRTNYFQPTTEGQAKAYLSIKLNSRTIPEMPLPTPLYEIFVYSPRFEGVHLRNTKVARGGIRWSDRREDFRTEILGLMKAQTVKNAVIVPSGAKGGFVLKALPPNAPRDVTQTEVIACYKAFISGLLDLTDNIVNKKIVQPKKVVCYDDDDPYLVVAADKGTAAFSDIANSLSADYQFWLGDAFASGGSTGYDHKKMGITARGAWESIKRHFRELNRDVHESDVVTVGIGDMSGDVFGNGMLYSQRIKLVAAFDHRHIFIDPDPDPTISYAERERLFNLPASSWADYNAKLISKGGGVFPRSQKSIPLSAQIKKCLDIQDNALPPAELIRAILKAPVDLLYNGGIGTYVKATSESQAEVGDRTNEYCRVNGNELRCKIVGEGGNLGFTQLGRIEYALNGGLINTDFIDNSAGVDCSDHEVNLKILLDHEVKKGKLSGKGRNQLLASLTEEVAELVLHDNFQQALVMSFSAYHATKYIPLYHNYLKDLETIGVVNRKVEYLPDDKTILERMHNGQGFTRPEIAVLLAYTKIHIKHALLKSNLLADPYVRQIICTAFPASVCKKFTAAIMEHPLNSDIIATQLSNDVVNEMGITFVYRLQMETGASTDEIVRAHMAASRIYDTRQLQKDIEALNYQIPMAKQYDMLYYVRTLLNLASRWLIYSKHLKEGNLEQIIKHFGERVKKLEDLIPEIMAGHTKDYLHDLTKEFRETGLPERVAKRVATHRAMYTALNIIEVATQHQFDLNKTAKVYFVAGERVHLLWFRDQIAQDSRDGHWNVLARLTLRDELDVAQRNLTIAVLKSDNKEKDAGKLIDDWVQRNRGALNRWEKLLSQLRSSTSIEYTLFFIAIRELNGLIGSVC